MRPTISISSSEYAKFRSNIRRLIGVTSRPIPDVLNAKAYFIARRAQAETIKASRAKIEALGLRTAGETQRVNKSGKIVRRRRLVFEAIPAVENYRKALVREMGGPAASSFLRKFKNRTEIERRARRWIAGKLKAIGFLKSIWRGTIASLSRFGGRRYGGRDRENDPFGGRHADVKKVLTLAAPKRFRVEFGVTIGRSKSGEDISHRQAAEIRRGFLAGWRAEAADTARHLEEKIKKSVRSAGF